jgi:hypothetical protein
VRSWWRADGAGHLGFSVFYGTKPIEFEKGRARNMQLTGFYAAELEYQGIGTLAVEGKAVVFRQGDGLSIAWKCESERDAFVVLEMFRLAVAEPFRLH